MLVVMMGNWLEELVVCRVWGSEMVIKKEPKLGHLQQDQNRKENMQRITYMYNKHRLQEKEQQSQLQSPMRENCLTLDLNDRLHIAQRSSDKDCHCRDT
jgi:hypothetical protein